VEEVSKNGSVDHFIIHARKAYLKGLNPAQNRNIPPLIYDRVYRLQEDFPHLKFTLNGGIKTLHDAHEILKDHQVWGCMIGRTAYENPYELIRADQLLYGHEQKPISTREEILYKYADYLDRVQN
jgi:tRNA-dihydrouridine synthase A